VIALSCTLGPCFILEQTDEQTLERIGAQAGFVVGRVIANQRHILQLFGNALEVGECDTFISQSLEEEKTL
jgi:hypothetical protein